MCNRFFTILLMKYGWLIDLKLLQVRQFMYVVDLLHKVLPLPATVLLAIANYVILISQIEMF